jgi:hypothetical protein
MNALIAFGITFVGAFFIVPMLLAVARMLGVYTIVQERRCHVYVLFGKVEAVIDQPGLHYLWALMDWKALIVNWMGTCYILDMRLDQVYLRSARSIRKKGRRWESVSGTKCLSVIPFLIYSKTPTPVVRCRPMSGTRRFGASAIFRCRR